MSASGTITSSANAKFFAELTGETLTFYREKNLLWRKSLSSPDASLIGLGNNGTLAVRAPDGIYLYSHAGEERNTPLERYATETLSATSSRVRSECMEERGTFLLLERVTEKTTLSERIWKGLGKEKKDLSQEGSQLHELLLVNLAALTEEQVWYHVAPKTLPAAFLWCINADFSYYVVCEGSHRTLPPHSGIQRKLFMVDRDNNRTMYQLSLGAPGLRDIRVNYQGIVLLRIEDEKERQLILVDRSGKKMFLTPPQTDYVIEHLGKSFVVLRVPGEALLILKTFEDKVMYSLDLSVLDRLRTSHSFFFRPNDDIILVGHDEDSPLLRIAYTTVDNFGIEYKRWQLLAEEEKREKVGALDWQAEDRAEIARRRAMELEESARMLSGSPTSIPSGQAAAGLSSPVSASGGSQRAQIFGQLERLKLKLVTGDLAQEEYERQRLELERELERAALAGVAANDRTAPPAGREPTATGTGVLSLDLPEKEPVAGVPRKTPKTPPPSSPPLQQRGLGEGAVDEEHEKTRRLLEKLEERFILGEISEKVYVDLKEKYERKLSGSERG